MPPGLGARHDASPRGSIRVRIELAAILTAGVALAGTVLVPALTMPGNDALGARVAESARNSGLGFLVTAAERLQYRLNPPRIGGTPDSADIRSLAQAARQAAAVTPTSIVSGRHMPSVAAVTLQPAIRPMLSPALRGEGDYVPTVIVRGQPAVQVAHLRPDGRHTSFLAGVAWMSSKLLRLEQHPGSADPGLTDRWSVPPTVPPRARAGLAATFNSGFKIADSRGTFYQDGHAVGLFRNHAASLVVYADGHADVGAWGSEVRMTPQVRSVRQNLRLLIDGGGITPETSGDSNASWGATIGSAAYVWRSGVGVTAAGDLVYAAGPALSVGSLANLLKAAGAVRAMELDINPEWISFMWYGAGASPTRPVPHKLVAFARPADRYFSVNSRDFFAVYTR